MKDLILEKKLSTKSINELENIKGQEQKIHPKNTYDFAIKTIQVF